jgi:hypothetical protein
MFHHLEEFDNNLFFRMNQSYFDDATWYAATKELSQALKDYLYTTFRFIGIPSDKVEKEIEGYLDWYTETFAC